MGWEATLTNAIQKQNAHSQQFTEVVNMLDDSQVELRTLRKSVKKLEGESSRLREENELLKHDLGCANGGKVGKSAARVLKLETETSELREEYSDFRKSHQKVINRYDTDLTASTEANEKLKSQLQRLQSEMDALSKSINLNKDDIRVRDGLITELSDKLKDAEQITAASQQKIEDMRNVKIKEIAASIKSLKNRQGETNLAIDTKQLLADFNSLKVIVEDAVSGDNPGLEEEIVTLLLLLQKDLQPRFDFWLQITKEELMIYLNVITSQETWTPATNTPYAKNIVSLLVSRLEQSAKFISGLYVPCSALTERFCALAGSVVEQLCLSIPKVTEGSALVDVFYKINTLSVIHMQYNCLESTVTEAWEQRPAVIRDKEKLCVTYDVSSSITPKLSDFCIQSSTAIITSVSSDLNKLYCIDMSHYKKHKNKSAFTKLNKHLRPSATVSLQAVLETVDSRVGIIISPGKSFDPRYKIFSTLLVDLSNCLSKILLTGGDQRWFYVDQHTAISKDLDAVDNYFEEKGIGNQTRSHYLSKLYSVVTVMSQSTEQLVNGGALCTRYADLPEEATKSVWCKKILRQVLAHRKDKKAKQFTSKHRRK